MNDEIFPAVPTPGTELNLCFLAIRKDTCKMLPRPKNSPEDGGSKVLLLKTRP